MNKLFKASLNKKDIEKYSKNTKKGAVFSERFTRTIRDLLKAPAFKKGFSKCIDRISKILIVITTTSLFH